MELYTKGISNIVEINPNSFISALELAEKSKTIITDHSPEWIKYLQKFKINLELISEFCGKIIPKPERTIIKNGPFTGVYKSFIPKLVIIKKGLFSGFFIYDTDIKKAYFYFNNSNHIKIAPLKKFSLIDGMPEYDLVISYSNKDIEFVRNKFSNLKKIFNIYFLDIEYVTEDPLWQIRYREAMYHSHYFIPFFSENYLTTQGALSEFFESVYLNIDFRSITFYNYFIPFVLGDLTIDKVKSFIKNNKNSFKHDFNYDINLFFEILNDVNFGLKIENYNTKELVIFLESLLINSKNTLIYLDKNNRDYNGNSLSDLNFFKVLLKNTEYIMYSTISDPTLKIVTLFIKNSENKWNILDVLSDGRCINRQFTTEFQESAIKVNEKTFDVICSFLTDGE